MAKTGRTATVALVAFMALGLAGRASGNDTIAKTEQPKPTIVLHVTNYAELSPEVIDAAKARVAAVYAVIGVRTVWDDRGMAVSRLQNGELHVNVLVLPRDMKQRKGSAEGTKAHVLGQAHLPSGRAYIFCDRIAEMAGLPASFPTALADVIAHEVGHLVLQEGGHSPSGIMRASLHGRFVHVQSFNRDEERIIRATLKGAN
jgi:hypothetical protein